MDRVHLSLRTIIQRVYLPLGSSILILVGTLGLLSAFPETGLAKPLPAPTLISNTISVDTTWTTIGSPYILDGSVTIAPNVTLTIEAGVEVQGRSNAYLNVQGHLETLGMTTDPVTFTSEANTGPGQWGGIIIAGGSADLRHTDIRYTQTGYQQPALYIWDVAANGQVNLQDTHFYDNFYHPLSIRADQLHKVSLTNNTFTNNNPNRIYLVANEGVESFYLTDKATLIPQTGLEGYQLQGNRLQIPQSITLTLAAGTQLMFPSNTYLDVVGHLETLGMVTNPVTLTSESDFSPGEWGGVVINNQ